MYISVQNQFGFIPKKARIFKGIFEGSLDIPKDVPTYYDFPYLSLILFGRSDRSAICY